MPPERKSIGAVYRVTAEFLRERGIAQAVLDKSSPATRQLIEKPPFAFTWHGNGALEEVERILFDLPRGRELCADLGLAACINLCGSLIQGVVRMSFTLFGQTPASLFSHADRLYSMVTTGYAFRYQALTEKSGHVQAEISGGPFHPSLLDQLRGNLSGAFPLCSVRGEVGLPEVSRSDAVGASVRYPVRWD